jgi:hypothetical protein
MLIHIHPFVVARVVPLRCERCVVLRTSKMDAADDVRVRGTKAYSGFYLYVYL